jgi:hypothetical protein
MRERLLLAFGGLLLIGSGFLPWRHPHNHWNELRSDLRPLLESVADGDAAAAAYFLAVALALVSPAWLGATLLVAAAGGSRSGRWWQSAVATLAALLLAALALAAGVYAALSLPRESSAPIPSAALAIGGAALTLAAMAAVEARWALGAFHGGGPRRADRRVLLLPLALFFVGAVAAALALRNYDQWHVIDYWTIAAGAFAGIAAVAPRPVSPQRP